MEPALGIIMLATRFPRPRGDAGNPLSWSMPVRFETVPEATVARVVGADPAVERLLPCLRDAMAKLLARGARLITTSCGFLSPWQQALQAASPVPVISSSLLALPALRADLPPGREVGVITFDSRALGAAHLVAAGADPATPVAGLEGGSGLYPVIREDLPRLDADAALADVLGAGEALRAGSPHLGAVLLECANLPPYRTALAAHLGLPVHDLVSVVETAWAALPAPSAAP